MGNLRGNRVIGLVALPKPHYWTGSAAEQKNTEQGLSSFEVGTGERWPFIITVDLRCIRPPLGKCLHRLSNFLVREKAVDY